MFLFKKQSRGKTYWYIGENKKVNGKSIRAWEIYLGSIETIYNMKQKEKERIQIKESLVFEFGVSAAILALTDQLQLKSLINSIIPSSNRKKVDTGTAVIIMMINHCIESLSKHTLKEWYSKSFLQHYYGLKSNQLSGQRIFDQMNSISTENIAQIFNELVKRVKEKYAIQFDCLLYDPTNFSTYITTNPNRPSNLPQWGKPKSGKKGFLQINLALVVTRQDGIPILHQVYQGNDNDPTEFKIMLNELFKRNSLLISNDNIVTLIFDKGNNSPKAFKFLEDSPYHFIGSLRPSTQKELMQIPLEDFTEEWVTLRKQKIKAYRLKKKVYDVERTVIITWYESSFNKSLQTLEENLKKAEIKLFELSTKINQPYYSTQKMIEPKIKKIVNKKSIKNLLSYTLREQIQSTTSSLFELSWERNVSAINQLTNTFGRSIIFTDHNSWTTQDIVNAYRSQWRVERDFRELKDPGGIKADPVRHWTDQTIQVHYFLCVLALFFQRLLHRIIRNAGLNWSLEKTLRSLKDIKQVFVVEKDTKKVHKTMTQLSKDQELLFNLFNLSYYHNMK